VLLTEAHDHNDHINRGTFWVLLVAVSVMSFSVLTLEVTSIRLLSVMLSYHYVFLAVSLVLLGLGAGGIFVYFSKARLASEYNQLSSLALFASLFSLAIPFSVIVIIHFGYMSSIRSNILFYCFLLFIPFFFAGIFSAQVFYMFPSISAWIYGADLVGAATGSLTAIFALNAFGAIVTCFLLGVIASIAALLVVVKIPRRNIRRVRISAIGFLIVSILFGLNLTGLYQLEVPIGANPVKEIHDVLYGFAFHGEIIDTRWSAFGRTDLVKLDDYPEHMDIYLDGTAGTPMYRFSGDIDSPGPAVSNLKDSFPGYFPFLFLKEEERDNALSIGPGGGRDILLALMGGVHKVTAVEVNKELVDMVREYSWYNGGIYTNPNVDVVVDEGRNFLKRQKERYDVIMLSLPVTNSSRSLEGYALTENFLFTTNSISDYLDHLTDEGRLVVVCHDDAEILRLLSISLASLNEKGISTTMAMKQIYMVGSIAYPIFVLKKTPFEPAEALLRYNAIYQFKYEPNFSYFPYIQTGALNPTLKNLGNGEIDSHDLEQMVQELGYDISPVTDNSPFFYKFEEGLPQPMSLLFWLSIIAVLIVVLVPLLWWKKSSLTVVTLESKRGFNRNLLKSIVLFSMLGIGFMLVEISLINKLVLFLGQPVLSMAALLFSILVGASVGSIYSARFVSVRMIRGIAIASVSIAAVLLTYTLVLPLVFNRLLGLDFIIRLLTTVVILLPLGFLMGFPFPLGLRLLKERGMKSYVPWMWGINGVCSVLGSVMTMVIAISFGFTEALLVGAGCYFIVFTLAFKNI